MIIKCLEVRDEATCIPVLAIKMVAGDPVEHKYLWRCGYPQDGRGVVLMNLNDQRATSDAYGWGDSHGTMTPAHLYIERHFDALQPGDVIDARVARDETKTAVEPEIWEEGGDHER